MLPLPLLPLHAMPCHNRFGCASPVKCPLTAEFHCTPQEVGDGPYVLVTNTSDVTKAGFGPAKRAPAPAPSTGTRVLQRLRTKLKERKACKEIFKKEKAAAESLVLVHHSSRIEQVDSVAPHVSASLRKPLSAVATFWILPSTSQILTATLIFEQCTCCMRPRTALGQPDNKGTSRSYFWPRTLPAL